MSEQQIFAYGCAATATTCQASCETTGCAAGARCSDHICVPVTCDEPDAPACPERWSCDPASSREQYADLNVAIAGSADSTLAGHDARHYIAMGCTRNLCDAPDGFTCGAGWTCAPNDPGSFGTGCVPTPCEEWGSCSTPRFLCEPTNGFRRPDAEDPHGCVSANCLESDTLCSGLYSNGEIVVSGQRCDPEHEDANVQGCVPRSCGEITEFEMCGTYEVCSPDSPNANSLGCVSAHCEKGDFECTGGMCEPTHEAATTGGCVYPPTTPLPGDEGESEDQSGEDQSGEDQSGEDQSGEDQSGEDQSGEGPASHDDSPFEETAPSDSDETEGGAEPAGGENLGRCVDR